MCQPITHIVTLFGSFAIYLTYFVNYVMVICRDRVQFRYKTNLFKQWQMKEVYVLNLLLALVSFLKFCDQ